MKMARKTPSASIEQKAIALRCEGDARAPQLTGGVKYVRRLVSQNRGDVQPGPDLGLGIRHRPLDYLYFVFVAVGWVNSDGGIWSALLIGGGLVLLYNTASIAAMIKHYREDKENIYSIDIRHLDEMRERAKSG